MHNNSVIELSREALQTNVDFLQKTFGKKVMLSSVVKGNAYGHGLKEFVGLANSCGIQHFSAFDAAEAKVIKSELSEKATVMIMGFIADEDLEWAIAHDIEFFVFEKIRLTQAVKFAKKLKKKAKVHIEVETGMNRTGFEKGELPFVAKTLQKETNHITFKGLCTHFAGAESVTNYYRVQKQIQSFEETHKWFCDQDLKPEIRHSACSAASMMFPETRMDLVRIGIMQYGLWSSPEVLVHFLKSKKIKNDPLRRVISWKSEIMNIKKVNPGSFIGYGNSYMASDFMKVAIIPIGYSHGYSRSLSNQGRVLIHGKQCAVIGTVNMNMITVDVTAVENIKKGTEVVLIGTQMEAAISIASFSDFSNQLNYEMLTRIAKSIPRKVI